MLPLLATKTDVRDIVDIGAAGIVGEHFVVVPIVGHCGRFLCLRW